MDDINLKQVMKRIDSKVSGVNEEAIVQFYESLLKEPIDFNLVHIDWLITTIIADFYGGADIGSPLSECFVDKHFLCNLMSKEFGVFNPLIYHFAMIAAENVTSPIVTSQSRIEYYSKVLSKLQIQFDNSLDDEERDTIQKRINYFESEIEKLKSNGVQL